MPSGYWLANNMQPGETLLTNQFTVKHYANVRMTYDEREKIYLFDQQLSSSTFNEESMSTADYVAIRTKHLDPKTIERINGIFKQWAVKEYSASPKEKLLIYIKK